MSDGSLSQEEIDALIDEVSSGEDKSFVGRILKDGVDGNSYRVVGGYERTEDLDVNTLSMPGRKNVLPHYMEGRKKLERMNISDEEIIKNVTAEMEDTLGVTKENE